MKYVCDRCHTGIEGAMIISGGECGSRFLHYHKVCPPPIDYRKILIAYIKTVGETEGVDFIDPMQELTDEENAELLELSVQFHHGGWQKEHRLKTAALFRAHKFVW
jgi:hypothetical protein